MPTGFRSGLPVLAIGLFVSGCQPDPIRQGHELWGSGRKEAAIESYRRAVELDAENSRAQSLLAARLSQLGRKYGASETEADRALCAQAAEIWETVVELEPEDLHARSQLGIAHFCAGQLDAADQAFEEARRVRYEVLGASPTLYEAFTTPDTHDLMPRAILLCEAALAADVAEGSASTRRFRPGPRSLMVFLDQLGVWRQKISKWRKLSWPKELQAFHPAEVRTLVCIRASPRRGATYGDGEAGYHVDWKLRAVRWPSGELLTHEFFRSTHPLPETKMIGGPTFVPGPKESVVGWLRELTAGESTSETSSEAR